MTELRKSSFNNEDNNRKVLIMMVLAVVVSVTVTIANCSVMVQG